MVTAYNCGHTFKLCGVKRSLVHTNLNLYHGVGGTLLVNMMKLAALPSVAGRGGPRTGGKSEGRALMFDHRQRSAQEQDTK